MSVCICIVCGRERDTIVCVEDRKVTFSDFSADSAVFKSGTLAKDCWIQYAGDVVEKAPFVLDKARLKIDSHSPDTWCPDLMAKALQEAWLEIRDSEIEAKILRKHGFTFDSFRDKGEKKCSEAVYDQLHDRIDRFEFPLEFLIASFDVDGFAHLNYLDQDGAVSCCDDWGFWAIGSGHRAALSSLAFHVDRGNMCKLCSCVNEAAYFACEAKFMAESSVHVGKESTFLSVHKAGTEPKMLFDPELKKIKAKWLKQGAPKPSRRVIEELGELIEEARCPLQTG